MKKTFFPFILLMACLSLVAFQCDDNDDQTSQEDEQNALTILKSEIESMANASVCNETATCKFMAFGSKPCGGPWSYLTYSTSIDEEKLVNLVKDYNKRETDFNTKWGIYSDCALVLPPTSMKCENNRCIPVY